MIPWLRVAVILAAIVLPLASPCQRAKNLLVLYRENPRLPGNIVATKVIQETIGQDWRYQIFDEYIEETRLETDFPTLAERIRQKYAGQKIDLVMTVGPRPFTFMRQYGEKLFPSVPIVFSEVDLRFYPPQLPPNTTGVSGSFDLSRTIDLILRVQPDTREVFYIGGSSPAELMLRDEAEREFKPYTGRTAFTYLNDLPFPQLLDRIGQLPIHSVVLYTPILRDPSGQSFLTANICPSITASSNAPVYTIFDTLFGCGTVGGSLYQVEASARQAAILALKILRGERVADLPVEAGPPNRVFVDWRQLERWGIPQDRLPAGSVVMYRQPPVWEAHKKLILATVAILLLQSALIALLVIQVRRRKRSEGVVRQLTRRLIDANENESRRLARELHDDIGQRLSLAVIQLELFGGQLPVDAGKNRTDLDSSIQNLHSLVSDVHNLSRRLHFAHLEHVGLKTAIAELCRQISHSYGLEIDLQVDEAPPRLAQDVSLCFYRVAQEALNNVVKHSNSNTAELILNQKPGLLRMQIRDLGVGFKTTHAAAGLGLLAMQERLASLGGRLSVESEPNVGTLVIAEAPIPLPNKTQDGEL
jgi:signal transduction histidine kinase